MLILKILALEPLNGWAISQRLKQMSSEVLGVSDGSLYPALHKLELRGWIRAQWKSSENNRRAKFYSLTRLGRKQLEQETANWNRADRTTVPRRSRWKRAGRLCSGLALRHSSTVPQPRFFCTRNSVFDLGH